MTDAERRARRRAAEDRRRDGRRERRVLLTPGAAAKAVRLAGPGREVFSAWVIQMLARLDPGA